MSDRVVMLLGGLVDVEWADTWAETRDPEGIRSLAADFRGCGEEALALALEVVADLAEREKLPGAAG